MQAVEKLQEQIQERGRQTRRGGRPKKKAPSTKKGVHQKQLSLNWRNLLKSEKELATKAAFELIRQHPDMTHLAATAILEPCMPEGQFYRLKANSKDPKFTLRKQGWHLKLLSDKLEEKLAHWVDQREMCCLGVDYAELKAQGRQAYMMAHARPDGTCTQEVEREAMAHFTNPWCLAFRKRWGFGYRSAGQVPHCTSPLSRLHVRCASSLITSLTAHTNDPECCRHCSYPRRDAGRTTAGSI